MRIAIHQANFIPWMPFFVKMSQADVFIILKEVQFPKNSWTNRCEVNGRWWTNPVEHGLVPIKDKKYTTGQPLLELNMIWILAIAKLLNIDTNKIKLDFPTKKKGTERIVEICRRYGANEYLANPEATLQYLDEKVLNDNGITLIPFSTKYKKHVFEYLNEIGIEKTRDLLNERKPGHLSVVREPSSIEQTAGKEA